jgi:Glycosyl hydrolase family 14
MGLGVLGALTVVVRDSLKSLIGPRRAKPRQITLVDGGPASPVTKPGIPVFVMLPLDATQPTCPLAMPVALKALADAGAKGVMVDVWWGLCEQSPGVYDFSPYRTLVCQCKDLGLLVQATMSFHACGGNVGDTVNIPLPDWVLQAGDEHGLWYQDRQGNTNRECLNLSADLVALLPFKSNGVGSAAKLASADQERDHATTTINGSSTQHVANLMTDTTPSETTAAKDKSMQGTGQSNLQTGGPNAGSAPLRTASEAYQQFMGAFLEAMGEDLVGSTVVELQVGCGPCGELRYPSYPLANGMWAFPGMGELQCFDQRMRESLADAAVAAGHPVAWGQVPAGTGTYNAKPRQSEFFSSGFKEPRGQFFLAWYATALLEHGRRMLEAASAATDKWQGLSLAVKVSGIHWWKFTPSRAAEATAGYYVSSGYNSYEKIAAILREFDAVLDFTCLEMRTVDQPFLKARCGPYQLVREVFGIARKAGIRVAGENALERYDWRAYHQIIKAFRHVSNEQAYGFTMLRLGNSLLEDDHMALFRRFVAKMKNGC